MSFFRKLPTIFPLFIALLVFVSPAFAAAPDGAGPWADSVLSSSQGLMKNGSPVPVIRSNPNSAVGVAENNTTEGNFFSLGFGGNIALSFDNGISSGVIIIEATNPGYPLEKAKIEVSENGTSWVNAGEVSADGSVNKPGEISCAKFVRVTDISNPSDFSDDTADGYDVDGVMATGDPCPPPTNGGDCGCANISQTSNTNISTIVVTSSNTGKNKLKNNTGGSNSITTGNANSNTNISITGGSNVVNASGCCCDGGGNTTVTIKNNGAGSTNTVNVNKGSKKIKKIKG